MKQRFHLKYQRNDQQLKRRVYKLKTSDSSDWEGLRGSQWKADSHMACLLVENRKTQNQSVHERIELQLRGQYHHGELN